MSKREPRKTKRERRSEERPITIEFPPDVLTREAIAEADEALPTLARLALDVINRGYRIDDLIACLVLEGDIAEAWVTTRAAWIAAGNALRSPTTAGRLFYVVVDRSGHETQMRESTLEQLQELANGG